MILHFPDSPLFSKPIEPERVNLWSEKVGGAFAYTERNDPLKHDKFTGSLDTITVLLRHNLHDSKKEKICKQGLYMFTLMRTVFVTI